MSAETHTSTKSITDPYQNAYPQNTSTVPGYIHIIRTHDRSSQKNSHPLNTSPIPNQNSSPVPGHNHIPKTHYRSPDTLTSPERITVLRTHLHAQNTSTVPGHTYIPGIHHRSPTKSHIPRIHHWSQTKNHIHRIYNISPAQTHITSPEYITCPRRHSHTQNTSPVPGDTHIPRKHHRSHTKIHIPKTHHLSPEILKSPEHITDPQPKLISPDNRYPTKTCTPIHKKYHQSPTKTHSTRTHRRSPDTITHTKHITDSQIH